MIKKPLPCKVKNCKERTPACQDTCKDFIDWRRELDEYNEMIREAKKDEHLRYLLNDKRAKYEKYLKRQLDSGSGWNKKRSKKYEG
jgi:hypothetical protein